MVKRFKLNVFRLLLSEMYRIKGSNSCFTDCILFWGGGEGEAGGGGGGVVVVAFAFVGTFTGFGSNLV